MGRLLQGNGARAKPKKPNPQSSPPQEDDDSMEMMMPTSGCPGVAHTANPALPGPQEAPEVIVPLPSVESGQHESGTCKPCLYFPTQGCQEGAACLFCHFPHTRKDRTKRSKKDRERLRQLVQRKARD